MARIFVKWKNIVILLLVMISIGLLISMYVSQSERIARCSNDRDGAEVVIDLCRQYHEGKLAGNLCEALCVKRQLKLDRCLSYNSGKLALLLSGVNHSLVLKSRKRRLTDYTFPGYQDSSGKYILPSEDTFFDMIRTAVYLKVKVRLNDALDTAVIDMFWSKEEFDQAMNSTQRMFTALVSLWALLQQTEYVLSKCIGNHQYIPITYGSCGHFYFVEYLPKIQPMQTFRPTGILPFVDHPLFFVADTAGTTWRYRARVAIELMKLVRALDHDLLEPLHLCDVKLDNFGVVSPTAGDVIVKVIDLDMAMFQSELVFQLQHRNCSNDDDCDFIDCHGQCNPELKKCHLHRSNSNLQTLCTNVLQTDGSLLLIESAPVQVKTELAKLIDLCSMLDVRTVSNCRRNQAINCLNTISSSRNMSNITELTKAAEEIWHELFHMLNKSIEWSSSKFRLDLP